MAGAPRLAVATQAAAAMTAPDDAKRTRFERVLNIPDINRWPFEHARILLAYGEYLRRARAAGEARVHLGRALDGFRVLGARPWAEKASSELRAAGAATGRPPTDVAVALTRQQLEIAQLAAQGLTNQQIGERLFLSHRTVAIHLYQLDPPPGAPVPPILPLQDGFLFLDREKFADAFAADVPTREAAFMADSQVPWGVEALNGTLSDPAWRSKPSWYLIATDDRMIPPAQRAMAERAGATTTEVPGSHAIYISQPAAVASLITQAARSLLAEARSVA